MMTWRDLWAWWVHNNLPYIVKILHYNAVPMTYSRFRFTGINQANQLVYEYTENKDLHLYFNRYTLREELRKTKP